MDGFRLALNSSIISAFINQHKQQNDGTFAYKVIELPEQNQAAVLISRKNVTCVHPARVSSMAVPISTEIARLESKSYSGEVTLIAKSSTPVSLRVECDEGKPFLSKDNEIAGCIDN